MRRPPPDRKPRAACPVCHQGFQPATDAEWTHRWNLHMRFSVRHKKYLALQQQTAGPQQDVRQ
jgi:hypothetical protein